LDELDLFAGLSQVQAGAWGEGGLARYECGRSGQGSAMITIRESKAR
jgi:hypothetical protein